MYTVCSLVYFLYLYFGFHFLTPASGRSTATRVEIQSHPRLFPSHSYRDWVQYSHTPPIDFRRAVSTHALVFSATEESTTQQCFVHWTRTPSFCQLGRWRKKCNQRGASYPKIAIAAPKYTVNLPPSNNIAVTLLSFNRSFVCG